MYTKSCVPYIQFEESERVDDKGLKKELKVEFRAKVADFGLTKVMDSVTPREHIKKMLQAAVVSSDEEDEEEDDDEKTQESSDEEQDGGGEKNTNLRQTMTSNEVPFLGWLQSSLMMVEMYPNTRKVLMFTHLHAFAGKSVSESTMRRGRRVS